MNKKQTVKSKNAKRYTLLSTILATAVVFAVCGYMVGNHKTKNTTPSINTPGYVTTNEARDEVSNFYEQYIVPGITPERKSVLLDGYGDKNLAFYVKHYQPGFEPLFCSTQVPTKVSVISAHGGPTGLVNATATFPDNTTETMTLELVLNRQGFKIDSIACAGSKANLL